MSYVRLLYHIVIRPKYSLPVLPVSHVESLYRYIWGIVKNNKGILYRINGMPDHIHILISLPQTIALSDFMREMKAETSKMLKRTPGFESFQEWGKGYAALSCSFSDRVRIENYIRSQQEHHRQTTFAEEYRCFIEDMGESWSDQHWQNRLPPASGLFSG